jgi:hypothetical protein
MNDRAGLAAQRWELGSLHASVSGSEVCSWFGGSFVVYVIDVSHNIEGGGVVRWTVKKQYSEWVQLRKDTKADSDGIKFPITYSTSTEAANRTSLLDEFLRRLLQVTTLSGTSVLALAAFLEEGRHTDNGPVLHTTAVSGVERLGGNALVDPAAGQAVDTGNHHAAENTSDPRHCQKPPPSVEEPVCARASMPRLQLFSRHNVGKHPELVAVIDAAGQVVNQTTGEASASVSVFLADNRIPQHLVLRYIDGPFKGKTVPQARRIQNAVDCPPDDPACKYAPGRVQVHSRSGFACSPNVFAVISDTGHFIHEGSGTVYRSKRQFLLANGIPANYVSTLDAL